jgi:hypothetical protein
MVNKPKGGRKREHLFGIIYILVLFLD